ncbi:hypothetical protein [Dongia sp.]|uniref:hypothetical protein n=1 Tax=Dongia sp. TaxID=1977262 RepID=UPI003751ABC9
MTTIKHLAAALPAAALIVCGTIGLGVAELLPSDKTGSPVGILVLGQDKAAAAQVIAAADGRLVATGGWAETVIAVSDDPDFVGKLYRAGASLVFRADNAIGCSRALPEESKGTS